MQKKNASSLHVSKTVHGAHYLKFTKFYQKNVLHKCKASQWLTLGAFGLGSSKVIRLAAVLRGPGGARFEALMGSRRCQDKDIMLQYHHTNGHTQQLNPSLT